MRDVEPPKQQNADVRDAWAKATANYRRDIEVLHITSVSEILDY